MPTPKKEIKRSPGRPTITVKDFERKQTHTVSLRATDAEKLKKKYGSLTKAIETLL